MGGSILVRGDGTPYRSYLYAADLAIWLWTILFKGKSCYPYNVGSDEDLTIAELAEVVASTFASKVEVVIAKEPIPGKPAERYVPSVKRAFSELQLKPLISLRESIIRTIDYASATLL
jgi:dTDP-glucose 4,6-dehydratase